MSIIDIHIGTHHIRYYYNFKTRRGKIIIIGVPNII